MHYLYCLLLLLVCSTVAHAEISAKHLPNIVDLDSLVDTLDESTINESIKARGGIITANLPAGESARGNAAAEIARHLSGGSAKTQSQLKDAFSQSRKEVESYLQQQQFAIGDMGVAYALSFITLWELASHKELSEQASLAAGKYMVHIFDDLGSAYAELDSAQKDSAYDFLMDTPIIFTGLVQAFEKEGKRQQVQQLRQQSAQLFKELTKIPHTFISFSNTGEFSVSQDGLRHYQKQQRRQ